MIKIIDGNNFYRRLLETDPTGLAPRSVLTDNISPPVPVIWVWDGDGANARRRKIYDGYKRNRTAARKDIYAGFETVQEVLKHTAAIQIKIPSYEGDDVIAALTRQLAGGGEQVEIWSNDLDFYQLVNEFPRSVFPGAKLKPNVPANLLTYYKVTVGDTSDHIPGIAGFGEGAWDAVDKQALVAFVDAIVAEREPPPIDLPKRCKVDQDLVRAYWRIVQFFPVSDDLIAQNMLVGVPNYAAANAYLKEFYL